MKPRYFAALLVSLTLFTGSAGIDHASDFHTIAPMHPDMGCTVVYATDGNLALGGNNEDYGIPTTKAWFIPAEEGPYGRV
jgi:hypothetical protein